MGKQGKKQINNKNSLFDCQLDILKIEINQIQEIIGRIDEITQQIKYWSIVIWAGSISLIIGNSNIELRKYLLFPIAIPFLFWIVDANFRFRQRKFIFRYSKISEFVSSENFEVSFNQKKIKEFKLLDPIGRQYDKEKVKIFANFTKSMWYRSLRTFYLGLIIVTILLQILLYPRTSSQRTSSTLKLQLDSSIILNQTIIIEELKEIKYQIDTLREEK